MTFQSLPILVPTLIDPLNSTTASLGSNATFTGTFSNLIAFPVVDVIIITDQPGTLFLDVSSDGVTVAQTTSFAVTTTLLFRSPFSWQYIRLRYTNGAIAQTTFFLQCILRPVDPGLASLPLNRTVSTNSIAPLNRAILSAQAPSGFFQNLQCDASNILLVDVSNFPSIQSVSGTVTAKIEDTSGNSLTSTSGALNVNITGSSGNSTVNQGTPNTLANGWPVEITDGTNILGTSSHPLRIDPTGTTTQPVSGTVFSKLEDGSGTAITSTAISGHQALDVNVIPNTNAVPLGSNISAFVTNNEVFTVSILLNQASSGTDNPLILIKNPNTNTTTLYLYKVSLGCTVANVTTIFRLFYDPTVTANGTTFTPVSNNIGGTSPASAMQVFTLSTVTSSGTALDTYTYGQNSDSLNFLEDFSIHLKPGHSILITGNPASNSRQASVTIVWAEL